jgi:outer membrane protein OmpA-like peptidoglycan-associated protein
MEEIAMKTFTLLAAVLILATPALTEEEGYENRLHVSVSGGYLDYEGDEPLDDAVLVNLQVGYDLLDHVTLEGTLGMVPHIDDNPRIDALTGRTVSRLSEAAGERVTETSSFRLSVDALLHLAPDSRIDPFLATGAGLVWYADDIGDRLEPVYRLGGGIIGNINDRWAVRADFRALEAGRDTEANLIATVGLMISLGARARPVSHAVSPAPEEILKKFELNIGFDPGKARIAPEYFSELDVIGRLMKKHTHATATIEGHVKKGDDTNARAARRLSERRARAVRDYLTGDWKIDASRLDTRGHGFDRVSNNRIDVTVK